MTRRQGMIAALTGLISIMTEKTRAQESVLLKIPRGRVTFPLDSYDGYDFSLNGKTVRFTPQEVFDALNADGAAR